MDAKSVSGNTVEHGDTAITRGPEGIYMHPTRTPGWGWDVVATPA
jgi:hypothetical protein